MRPMASSLFVLLAACASPGADLPVVFATAETEPVMSRDDAADDPAIWINFAEPERSLILGTDKQRGIHAYTLDGRETQFLALPEPNNIDLRQALYVGDTVGDFAVTSNRGDNTISILGIDADGITELARLPVATAEPYGICMGASPTPLVAITHKTGELDVYRLDYVREFSITRIGSDHVPGVQMEGCVFDEAHQALYVGYEPFGIVRFDLGLVSGDTPPRVIDSIGSGTRLVEDIEGLAIYETGPLSGYLLVSVQGDNSFQAYDRITGEPKGRFRIGDGPNTDGAEETDGIAVTSADLGQVFPEGLFVAQDGFNRGESRLQNFKIVNWEMIRPLLAPAE